MTAPKKQDRRTFKRARKPAPKRKADDDFRERVGELLVGFIELLDAAFHSKDPRHCMLVEDDCGGSYVVSVQKMERRRASAGRRRVFCHDCKGEVSNEPILCEDCVSRRNEEGIGREDPRTIQTWRRT